MTFKTQIEDWNGDSWSEYVTINAESAAELAAEDYYNHDAGDPNDFTCDVKVKFPDGSVIEFSTYSSVSINFYANPKRVFVNE